MLLKITILAALVLGAAPALACDDGGAPVNLRATAAVKAGLTTAYRAAHPGAQVRGPVPGRTWYGLHAGYEFAVASFGEQPSVFSRPPGGRWHFEADTHGAVCPSVVPAALLAGTWWYERGPRGCYVEPS